MIRPSAPASVDRGALVRLLAPMVERAVDALTDQQRELAFVTLAARPEPHSLRQDLDVLAAILAFVRVPAPTGLSPTGDGPLEDPPSRARHGQDTSEAAELRAYLDGCHGPGFAATLLKARARGPVEFIHGARRHQSHPEVERDDRF